MGSISPPDGGHHNENATRENVRMIFDSVDTNKDGSLDFHELQRAFHSAGLNINEDQVKKMIEVADENKNNTIEFDEFYKFASKLDNHTFNSISEYWLQYSTKPIIRATGAPAWKLLIAGGVAGAVSRTCTSPLERLKILNQVRGVASIGVNNYVGVISSLTAMWNKEGWVGFFKGNGTNVIRIAPYSAIQFLSYEKYKKFMVGENRVHMTPGENLLAGGMAGVTSLLCTYPLDLIRSRLTIQTTEKKYNGIMNTFATVVKEEGYRGLYKGVFTSILGVAPYVAINFTTYETLKQRFEGENNSVSKSLVFGAISGATAQTFTYPIDLLRRRMQLQGMGGEPIKYTSTINAIQTIIKEEGFMALYRGMVPCYLKVVPAISISFGVYELMRIVLGIETRKVSFSS